MFFNISLIRRGRPAAAADLLGSWSLSSRSRLIRVRYSDIHEPQLQLLEIMTPSALTTTHYSDVSDPYATSAAAWTSWALFMSARDVQAIHDDDQDQDQRPDDLHLITMEEAIALLNDVKAKNNTGTCQHAPATTPVVNQQAANCR